MLVSGTLLCSTFMSCSGSRRADEVQVSLHRVEGTGPISAAVSFLHDQGESGPWSGAFEKVHNVPADLRDVSIRSFEMQNELFFLQAYHEHLVDPGLVRDRIKQLTIDTVHIPPRHVNHEISLVAGFDSLGRAVIIVDTNNDEDMGNDERLIIPHVNLDSLTAQECRELNDRFPKPFVSYEYFDGNKIAKAEMRMTIWPYLPTARGWRFQDSVKMQILLAMGTFEYRQGTVRLGDSSYTVVLSTRLFDSGVYTLKNSRMGLFPSNSMETLKPQSQTLSHVSDVIKVGGEHYRVAEIHPTGEWIKLIRTTAPAPTTGSTLGSNASPLVATTLDGKSFDLEKVRGRHVLLDFWSITCAPCVREFPYLNDLAHIFPMEKLLIIGIAADTRETLSSRLVTLRLDYPQIPAKEHYEQILKDYRVEGFPTTYVIDPQGRIAHNSGLRGPEFFTFLSRAIGDSGSFKSIVLNGNVHFTCSISGANRVEVSGDFSDWKQLPMYNVDGSFRRDMQLPRGEYQYRFFVDGIAKLDPANALTSVAIHGDRCSILKVP